MLSNLGGTFQSNIARGAVLTKSGILVGGLAEYCMVCESPMSSDGCSNQDCHRGRPVEPLQKLLKLKAQGRMK